MQVQTVDTYERLSDRAAEIVSAQIRGKPNSVIGFATGGTPGGLYKRLIREHRERGLDFSKIVSFNLDEYIGLGPDHSQSYHSYMWDHLFEHVNVNPSRMYIPDGLADDMEQYCRWYERRIDEYGGIDLQILGIGANGHIGFNEPGASLASRTHITKLAQKTIEDNARFFTDEEDIPRRAITMGIGTIMDADKIILLASGKNKADAIRATLEGPVTAMVPASVLQMHPEVTVLLDTEAAGALEYNHHDGIAESRA
jgi:glucosamine-6-phosphate deaminase